MTVSLRNFKNSVWFQRVLEMGLFVPSDIMKSKSNPDFLKKDRTCVSRQLRNIRSKVILGPILGVGCWHTLEKGADIKAHYRQQHGVPRVSELAHPHTLILLVASCPLHATVEPPPDNDS